MSPAAVLELIGVVKDYPGGVQALRGVDLTVCEGELCAIVGPSGSGKSTLLYIMGTLERPTGGIVRIAGSDVAEASDGGLAALRARRIGFVFQQFHLMEADSGAGERRQRPALHGHACARAPPGRGRGAGAGRAEPPRAADARRCSQAGSASAWRSPAHSSALRRSCSRTSRPATWTQRAVPASWNCCTRSTRRARRWS